MLVVSSFVYLSKHRVRQNRQGFRPYNNFHQSSFSLGCYQQEQSLMPVFETSPPQISFDYTLGVDTSSLLQGVPEWIYTGPKEIKRSFLSAVFGGEGSAPFKNRWRIQFVLSKDERYIENLLEFMNQIRAMLNYFGIKTTYLQLRKQAGRHHHARFYITGKENIQRFYKELEFSYASEKQEALNKLILQGGKRGDLVNTHRAKAMMNGSNSGAPTTSSN